MKHQAWAFLLLGSFLWSGNGDKPVIADKSQRVGRFSYEDSFDEKSVQKILKNSSAVVKKNVQKLLYPDNEEDMMAQRLLLLGGVSNASTTAIAKAIALRCGYEYYVIEAAPLLRDYREGRLMILNEVRTIVKQGKPVAIIITELPEMTDYSGILASTLWLIVDQCTQYPDVLVIGTSAFQKGQLSEDVKKRFGGEIISVGLAQDTKKNIKKIIVPEKSWIKKHKALCVVVAGITCFGLAIAYEFPQIVSLVMQACNQQQSESELLEQNRVDFSVKIGLILEENNKQIKLYEDQLLNMQEELTKSEKQINRLVELYSNVP